MLNAFSTSNSRYKGYSPKLGKLNEFVASQAKVVSVNVHGKFMYWTFENNWHMLCTFGMTGQWSPICGKHPCFVFEFHDGSSVYFNDPRHFGTIQFIRELKVDKLSKLGWDPLGGDSSKIRFVLNKCQKTSKPIGQLLMDQSLFSGVGNYIRAEALYLARMSPWRPSNTISEKDFILLCRSLIEVMNDSYNHQGATILTYKDAYGAEGKYSSCFKVYGQKTDPLGYTIIKEETPEGRTIHWCPSLQS